MYVNSDSGEFDLLYDLLSDYFLLNFYAHEKGISWFLLDLTNEHPINKPSEFIIVRKNFF